MPYKVVLGRYGGGVDEIECATRLEADNLIRAAVYVWVEFWAYGERKFRRYS